VLAALALLLAAAVAPPPQRFVVLVEADDSARPGASIDDSVRTTARYRLGVQLLSPEEAFVEGGRELESGLATCGADAACLAERLRAVRADFAILLVVRRVAFEHLIALRVVRTSTGEIVHKAVLQAQNVGQIGATISTITAAAFDALGYKKGGELIVTSTPNNAELFASDGVAGHPITAGRATLLSPGSYVVRARLADFEDAVQEARVEEGSTQTIALSLAPKPEEITAKPWFWAGVGLAATAIGVAIAVGVTGSDRCFCAAADQDACGSCP
jgi:hypothetical protein